MLRRRLKNPIFLIYLLVIYVTLQFSWWLYLIFSLYNKIYSGTERLQQKTWMLLGEGSVFFVILILGVIVILRAFKRERELTQQQENFVLSVTHELKTPIASVKLFLQTLQKRELPPEKRTEIYNRSLVEMNRLNDLVNNILLTRNIENDNYFLNKEPIDISRFIEEKVALLSTTILQKHEVKAELTKDIILPVDKLAFESIIVNLLENAAKYSPKESTVMIKLFQERGQIHLRIIDEGVGIPKEKRDKAFTKFYREENEMTRKSKGTGLGLYITRFLVEQHNGQISLGHNRPKGLVVAIQFKK